MNDENLIPMNKRTPRERSELGKKGNIASTKKKRENKLLREIAPLMLQGEMTDSVRDFIKAYNPLIGENKGIQAAVASGAIFKGMQGDINAINKLEEWQNASVKAEEHAKYNMPITDITSDFVEVYREMHEALETGKWREFILKGGRGSIKSNFISGFAKEVIKNDPKAHVVFTRRYKTDLRGSVFNQFQKTVIRDEEDDEWEFTTSPMMAKYKKTGQCVIFVGCDKPQSLKSYNLTFGHIKLIVNEEADEMAGIEQIDNVEDTFLRADTNSISVKIFNPPKSANNWMNKYTVDAPSREKCYVCHSYYYNVPVKWLGQRFFDRAEWFKKNKEKYYKNNYLGEVVGTGGTIFENLEFREITQGEIDTFSLFYYGLDWGYEHPQAFIECSYDEETDTIYAISEVRKVRMSQEMFAAQIEQFKSAEIICDSANPDKIAKYQDMDFNTIGAVKRWSGGGKDYSWEFLQTVNKIVIDQARTPFLAEEMRSAEHEQLKDGSFSSEYPQKNDDCIDALRYALNRVILDSRRKNTYYDDNDD